MTLRKSVNIHKKSGEMRGGRGFSREELKQAGISLNQALRLRLPVDLRRRSVHHDNVEFVKQRLQRILKIDERYSKVKKKASRRKRSQGSKS